VRAQCLFNGCGRASHGGGLCKAHYAQRLRGHLLCPLRVVVPLPDACTFPGCGRRAHAAGLCGRHRLQQRAGVALHPVTKAVVPRGLSPSDQFWLRVDKNGPTVRHELGPCWVWMGRPDKDGYGTTKIGVHGRIPRRAHRQSWLFTHGEDLPSDVLVCHRCDNPPCVRPDHLFKGTQKDNVADRDAKGRTPRNGLRKLSDEDVREIRRLRGDGMRIAHISKRFSIAKGSIANVVYGKSYRDVA
jgi:hypothetical protein